MPVEQLPQITVEVQDHVATVTMNRPPVNAMDRAFISDLKKTFLCFDDWMDVRAVVLASACGPAFIAGLDMKNYDFPMERSDGDELDPRRLDAGRPLRECFDAVFDCTVPVIAAVDGPALGGGLAVVACCDVIVATPKARFGLPELKIGLLGAGSHLLRMVGPYRMREAFFTSEWISAEEMHRLGAVSRVVPSEKLLDEAHAIAATIAQRSAASVRLAKTSLNRCEFEDLKAGYRIEQDYTARIQALPGRKSARHIWRSEINQQEGEL
jgi:enoyl-CoA hydratase